MKQVSTGRRRALKVMRRELVADADLRRRFEQEARISSLFESPYVVEVIAAGVEGDTPWIAMELLSGEDLDTRLTRGGPLGEMEVRRILGQVCDALGNAHRAGVVHRDLKLENVFLATGRSGGIPVVKLLDFGIAKINADRPNHTVADTLAVGSPIWMAPEQTDHGMVTPAADVWALGLLAFTLFTGKVFWRSFGTPNVHRVIKEVTLDPIPLASERARELGVADDLPVWFDPWFSRCVARDPARRFANATTAGAIFGEPIAPPSTVGARSAPISDPREPALVQPSSSSKGFVFVLLATAVGLTAAGGAVFGSGLLDKRAQAADPAMPPPRPVTVPAPSAEVVVAVPSASASPEGFTPPAAPAPVAAKPKPKPKPKAAHPAAGLDENGMHSGTFESRPKPPITPFPETPAKAPADPSPY